MASEGGASGGGSQSALRRSNNRLILESLREGGPASQAALGRRVGLSRSAVNAIVRDLESAGQIEISAGTNRRETVVSLGAASGALIAIDLGHQRIHGSLISFDRELRLDEVVDLGRDHEAHADVTALVDLVDTLLGHAAMPRAEVRTVYLGVHAPFEWSAGTIAPTGILSGWEDIDIRAVLAERTGLTVTVDNDANFAALAEWTWGAGRGSRDFLYVKSSNGVGAGLVLNGSLYRGAHGLAGELGHIVVDERGPLCNCGSRGCLSAVASGRAVLLELAAAGAPRPDLRTVISDAQAGDLACRRLLSEAGRFLGIALTQTVKILDPDTIAFGGELAAAGALIFDSVGTELAARALRGHSGVPVLKQGMRRGDMCILGCAAADLSERGRGLTELPSWILTPTGAVRRAAV
jgi:predicted NBD/HSP70 family sugar kinase/biotin operon repressor